MRLVTTVPQREQGVYLKSRVLRAPRKQRKGKGTLDKTDDYCTIVYKQINIYAYDAYFLDCAVRYKSPLLTLDGKRKKAAGSVNVETLEV